jgi:hypothetical protein
LCGCLPITNIIKPGVGQQPDIATQDNIPQYQLLIYAVHRSVVVALTLSPRVIRPTGKLAMKNQDNYLPMPTFNTQCIRLELSGNDFAPHLDVKLAVRKWIAGADDLRPS